MKKIIDIKTKEQKDFSVKDLPIMIHGREHSGASLFSITLAASLHMNGYKFLIFTAYPMAWEEFLAQTKDNENVFYLEDEKDVETAVCFQTIFVQSGNVELFKKIVVLPIFSDRVIFIKNIETINSPIFDLVKNLTMIVSGDFELNKLQIDFKLFKYETRIFLSPIEGESLPVLEKYQAYLKNAKSECYLTITND